MSIAERIEVVKATNLCWKCLLVFSYQGKRHNCREVKSAMCGLCVRPTHRPTHKWLCRDPNHLPENQRSVKEYADRNMIEVKMSVNTRPNRIWVGVRDYTETDKF